MVAGSGFCALVYWFKAQGIYLTSGPADILIMSPLLVGRVPTFVTRFPGLFYGLGFLAAFVSGANSYRKTCFQRLMSLENSFIASKIREVYVTLLCCRDWGGVDTEVQRYSVGEKTLQVSKDIMNVCV